MATQMEEKLSTEDKKRIGDSIRRHLQDNAVKKAQDRSSEAAYITTPTELAYAAGVSPSTIFKMHSGDFSMKGLRLVQGILNANFIDGEVSSNADKAAPNDEKGTVGVKVGGYTQEQIAPYLGRFLTVRRGTTIRENLLTTMVEIYWDDELGGARFHEKNKFTTVQGKELDYSQSGTVHQSSQIGVLHLLTSFEGAIRLVTLTRLQVMEPVMYGAILTQVPEAGNFIPARATVHFRKVGEDESVDIEAALGVVTPDSPNFLTFESDLEEARRATLAR